MKYQLGNNKVENIKKKKEKKSNNNKTEIAATFF